MSAAEPTRSRPERRIGRYRITGRIGRGGMGMVYRGRDESLERDVAVKTLTLEGSLDDESRKRFEIEAKAAARLQHPNIVTIFELAEDRGVAFIAMELLPGVDLETLLRSGEELLLEEKLDVVAQAARGLAYAHQRGVVHRDMKPSNVRLLDDGRVKIMDFGIAKLGSTAVTKSGMMVGTVHYMSPEQIRSRPLDGRSDVFSLGVILYELLSGRRPFSGSEATHVLYNIVHEAAAPLELAPGPHGPRLRAIVERALAKQPEERHASAAELADDLEDVLAALRREREQTPAPGGSEGLGQARRLLSEGRTQEGLERLRELVARFPDEPDARRALRTAQRSASGRAAPAADEDYPELDATFQVPGTLRATSTLRRAAEAARATPLRRLVLGAGILLVLALGAGAAFVLVSHEPPPPPAGARLRVRSQPAGAAILVDGRDTGLVTEAEIVLPEPPRPLRVTLRSPGYVEATRELRPPFPGQPLVFELREVSQAALLRVASDPPGAQVSLDGAAQGRAPLELRYDPRERHTLAFALAGHEPRELTLEPGDGRSEVSVALEPRGTPGTVSVASSYPLDVIWQGQVLAREQTSPRVTLPEGRQAVTLVAAPYFLRSTVNVTVRGGGESALAAPGLGRLNVRATPDNCEVFINGAFADYPPIRDRRVAAGAVTVGFKWPDGTRREVSVQLAAGAIEYVTGRRD